MASHGGAPDRPDFSQADAAGLTPRNAALFLDVDGTLLELAATPDTVIVEPGVIELLRRLTLLSGGAIALVSGRSIAVLDELFAPLMLPVAGLHGFERRNANGVYSRRALPAGSILDRARRLMGQVAARHPALLLEDKRFAVALHYRQVPDLEHEVVADVVAISRLATLQLDVQRGRKVIELLPKCTTKARAVEEFMDEPPFSGRCPIYLGDDLTDECAFDWVNSRGGLSVAVNVTCATAAGMRLGSVTEVRGWLQGLLEHGH